MQREVGLVPVALVQPPTTAVVVPAAATDHFFVHADHKISNFYHKIQAFITKFIIKIN